MSVLTPTTAFSDTLRMSSVGQQRQRQAQKVFHRMNGICRALELFITCLIDLGRKSTCESQRNEGTEHVVGGNGGQAPLFASLCESCAAVPPHLTFD
jgi:hypothetical protein